MQYVGKMRIPHCAHQGPILRELEVVTFSLVFKAFEALERRVNDICLPYDSQ